MQVDAPVLGADVDCSAYRAYGDGTSAWSSGTKPTSVALRFKDTKADGHSQGIRLVTVTSAGNVPPADPWIRSTRSTGRLRRSRARHIACRALSFQVGLSRSSCGRGCYRYGPPDRPPARGSSPSCPDTPGGSARRIDSSWARAAICWANSVVWIPWKRPSSQPTN